MQLNRSISFTYSWKYTVLISIIMSVFISSLILLLQPFDTYQYQTSFKILKLTGYSICIIPPIIIVHLFEQMMYLKNRKKWTVSFEIVAVFVGFVLISVLAYIYNSTVINRCRPDWSGALNWSLMFGLPFIPVFVPLWVYLRFRFSKITLTDETKSEKLVTVTGNNRDEQIQFPWTSFILARSQSNYVEVYVFNPSGETVKHILRSTLSSIVEQLPSAMQIHRSYIVNISHIEKLNGNSRQGSAKLNGFTEDVPVSPKHFTALKKSLQLRP